MVPWAHLSKLSQSLNGISIGSAVFAGHIRVTNTYRQITLRASSVAIGRIYVVDSVRFLVSLLFSQFHTHFPVFTNIKQNNGV